MRAFLLFVVCLLVAGPVLKATQNIEKAVPVVEPPKSEPQTVQPDAPPPKPDAPPRITPIPDQTAVAGQILTFDVIAEDDDGSGTPVLTMVTHKAPFGRYPPGAEFIKNDSSRAGQFRWKIDRYQSGNFSVIFSATDGIKDSTQIVKIKVLPRSAGLPQKKDRH